MGIWKDINDIKRYRTNLDKFQEFTNLKSRHQMDMIDFTPSISFDPTPPTPKTTWSHPFLHESSLEGTTWALRCPKIGVFKTLGHRLRHPVFSLGAPKHVVSALNLADDGSSMIVIGGLNSPAERPGKCRRAESRTNRAGSWQIRHRHHLETPKKRLDFWDFWCRSLSCSKTENRDPTEELFLQNTKKHGFCRMPTQPKTKLQRTKNSESKKYVTQHFKTRDESWVQGNFTKKLPAIPESKSPGGLPAPSQWQLFETSTLVVPAPFLSWTSC